MRLDQFLAQKHPEISRHFIKELILSGKVRVNGQFAKPSYPVKETDQLNVEIPNKLPSPNLVAEDIPLKIVFENENFIVIDKPAGLVVHPAAGHRQGTLVNALLHHLGERFSEVGERSRPGLVHRLDKDTSGLLIVAKTEPTRVSLVQAFKDRNVHKEYLALISGTLAEPAGEINKPIGRDDRNRLKFAISDKGKEATTRYFTEKVLPNHTLLRVLPLTGRTHQIRVHLASIGHPIVGDKLYGGEEADRLFLHATKLQFILKGKEWAFESSLPEDLTKILTSDVI